MSSILKNLSAFLLTLIIVVGIGVPHICLDEHSGQKTSVSEGQHKHTKTSKAADHCCVSHHCCAGKLLNSANAFSVKMVATTIVFSLKDQTVSSFDVSGLDRPPKSIA